MSMEYKAYSNRIALLEMPIVSASRLYRGVWKDPPWNEEFSSIGALKEILKPFMKRYGVAILAKQGRRVIGGTTGWVMNRTELSQHMGMDFSDKTLSLERVFYIAEVFVHSSMRGKGIGRKLTEMLMKEVESKSVPLFHPFLFPTFVLRTDVGAIPARELYSSLGFLERVDWIDDKHPNRTYWIKG